jgi:hypothetical protein
MFLIYVQALNTPMVIFVMVAMSSLGFPPAFNFLQIKELQS